MVRPRSQIALMAAVALLLSGSIVSTMGTARGAPNPCPYPLTRANRPVAPPGAPDEIASFTDPTAETQSVNFVRVGEKVYIAPFARLEAQSGEHDICIEHASNVQDNTLLKVNGGPMHVGEESIIAHGAQMVGDGNSVSIAHVDACPLPPPHVRPVESWPTPAERGRQALADALSEAHRMPDCHEVPAFIGFNALNHSHVADGALLGATSRLAREVTLRAGYSSFPGKSLDTQAQAETACGDPQTCEVRYVTAGDIEFMYAVLHVNECLAKGYTMQYRDAARAIHPFGGPDSVEGIGIDPGSYHRCEFNNSSERPTLGYPVGWDLGVRDFTLAVHEPSPPKKIRIIGDVRMIGRGQDVVERQKDVLSRVQDNLSIRADEGEPMGFREGVEWGFANTFHALEPTPEDEQREIRVFGDVKFEERVVVHGGGRRVRGGGPDPEPTLIENGVFVGKESVIFRSHLAEFTRVGARAVIVGYDSGCDADGNCTPGEVIPDGCVKFIDTPPHRCAYFVEW